MVTQILRLKRTDKGNEHLLLHISQTSTFKPLDLKLVATEQEHLFHGTLKDSQTASLLTSASKTNPTEWKTLLKHQLLHEQPPSPSPETDFTGLETVATIANSTLTITLRKNISGIIQRLGSFTLTQDDEREEIGAFEWVDQAVQNSDDLRLQLEQLQFSFREQQDHVTKLNQQLDELVEAKREHENQLLSKFTAVLNAKKLKIRDQQRLLAGAKVDSKVAEAVAEARGGRATGRKAAGSARSGKRKAEVQPDDDDDAEEDVEMAEADVASEADVQQETPPGSDRGETEDEEDLDVFAPVASPGGTKGSGVLAPSARGGDGKEVEEPEALPPRRELPFARKDVSQEAAKTSQPVVAGEAEDDDDDDDETDDEL